MASFENLQSDPSVGDTANKLSPKLNTKIKDFSKKEKEEFWIRWYPDDIHLNIPIGKFTEVEKSKWSRFEREIEDLLTKKTEESGVDESIIREQLKKLIDDYLRTLKQALVDIIKQSGTDKSNKLNNFKKWIEEESTEVHNKLFIILDNKDSSSLKKTAFKTLIERFYSLLMGQLSKLLEFPVNIRDAKSLIEEMQTKLIEDCIKIVEISKKDTEKGKMQLGEILSKQKNSLLLRIPNLINKDIQDKINRDSAQKINELTEKLVEDSVKLTQPVELHESKKREMLAFLETTQKDENTFHVDFVNKLLMTETSGKENKLIMDILRNNKTYLEETFGIIRARQLAKHSLMKSKGKSWDFDTELEKLEDPLEILIEKGMKINTLPPYLHLYTIKDGTCTKLTPEPVIIQNDQISILPDDLSGSNWITDFNKALSLGMGIKITEPELVSQIKDADWLTAVGFGDSEELHANLEEILKRRNANGDLSILPQDSPTNNTESLKSPYKAQETDLIDYFNQTSSSIPSNRSFNGAISQMKNKFTDSHKLTSLLKFDSSTFGEIKGTGLQEQNYATAMNMLLWDACTFEFKRIWTEVLHNSLPDWQEFSRFFFENVRARGNFPIIRIGKTPYGILPVIPLKKWEPIESIGENAKTLKCIYTFFKNVKTEILSGALGKKQLSEWAKFSIKPPLKVPTLTDASDDESYDTFLEILRNTRVSQELEVRILDPDDIFNLNNDPGYVKSDLISDSLNAPISNNLPSNTYKETAYLHYLSQMGTPLNFNTFKNETLTENPPVLKRLIYYLLEYHDIIGPTPTDQMLTQVANLLKQLTPDKLKILLMEFLDLLTYRTDAWITGLAHERLMKYSKFEQENVKPQVGVYGWLEKPGVVEPAQNSTSEYIQAPSQDQAVTAALLRNASLMSGVDDPSGQFRINLSSDQIQKGMWYFDGLRHNHLPEELLGYQIERYIHDNKEQLSNIEELDIYKLRKLFPLKLQDLNPNTENTDVTYIETIINGVDFLEVDLESEALIEDQDWLEIYDSSTLKKKRTDLLYIQNEIRKFYDSAADIATAEVLYQYLRGNMARTSAWLDFLDGESLPPEPQFTKLQRTGDRRGTKVLFLVEPPDDVLENFENGYNPSVIENLYNPRKITSPILNHLSNTILGDLTNETIEIMLNLPDGEQTSIPFNYKDLKFDAIDFIVGGENELELRIKYLILQDWQEAYCNQTENSIYRNMGPFPEGLTIQELFNQISITYSLDPEFVNKIRLLKKLIHQNIKSNLEVSLEPNAELDVINYKDAQQIDLIKTIEILVKRAEVIYGRLCQLNEYLDDIYLQQPFTLQILLEKLSDLYNIISEENDSEHLKWIKLAEELEELRRIIVLFPETPDIRLSESSYVDLLNNITESDDSELLNGLKTHLADTITELNSLLTKNPFDTDVFYQNLQELSRYGYKQALLLIPKDLKSLKQFNKDLDNLLDLIMKKFDNFFNQVEIVTKSCDIETEMEDRHCSLCDVTLSTVFIQEIKTELDKAEDWEEKIRLIKEKKILSSLISNLQKLSEGQKLPIFTPYVLTDDTGLVKDWNLNLESLKGPHRIVEMSDNNPLNHYKHVRKKVNDLVTLLKNKSEYQIYEKVSQTEDSEEGEVNRFGTNYLYVSPFSNQGVKCFSCIYIDDWVEFFPNMKQNTGVAYRYDAPQTEAPNAILLAIPPRLSKTKGWTSDSPDLLADTIMETIDLMQMRMTTSYDMMSSTTLGKILPALIFRNSDIGQGKSYQNALFPQKPKISLNLNTHSPFFHIPSNYILSNINQSFSIGEQRGEGK